MTASYGSFGSAVELVRTATSVGFSPGITDDGVVEWASVLTVGTSRFPLLVEAVVDDDTIFLEVRCAIVRADMDRLREVEVAPPLSDVDAFEEKRADDPGDVQPWLVAHGAIPAATKGDGLRACTEAAGRLFEDLARAGIVRIAFAIDQDLEITALIETLTRIKGVRPGDAVELARTIADRCRATGDYWLGSWVDMVAVEVLAEMGAMERCRGLAEPAWEVLGRPVDDPVLSVGYATALGGTGDSRAALELLDRAQMLAEDPGEVSFLRANRAIMLIRSGRVAQAIPLLEAAVVDPHLGDEHRDRTLRALTNARRSLGRGQAVPLAARMDILDDVDDELDDIASVVLVIGTHAGMAVAIPQTVARLERLRAKWDSLGPAQRARLLMVEGTVSHYRGDPVTGAQKLRAAQAASRSGGDTDLVRAAASLIASTPGAPGFETALEPPRNASPTERLMFHFNRAYHAITTAVATGSDLQAAAAALPHALAAVIAVDGARHDFTAIADRRAFVDLGRRSYAMAITLAAELRRPTLVLELLERLRAQGLPAAPKEDRPDAGSVERTLGNLLVSRPAFATLSGRSEIEPERAAVRLAAVVARMAGPDAWWWTCQPLGPNLAWAVWTPTGGLEAGVTALDEPRRSELQEIAAFFDPPSVAADLAAHPLVSDGDGRRERVLRSLACSLLPRSLADAAATAAQASRPIRVVWAPSVELGNVPVGLLPIDGGRRLLHGAVITLAVPTSLALAIAVPPAGRQLNPETVVLGSDDRLSFAPDIVGPTGLGVPPGYVLGAPTHLADAPAPLAAALATPGAVLRSWAAPSPRLTVYYGHVDEARWESPLTTSLRLSDGHRSVPLEVGELLTPERRGAPDVAVLCGCSSLEPASLGSGEWWSFAVAMLWQGSRQVLGSLWSLVDCASTARFTVELASRLRRGEDPALALNRLQVEWLGAWERGGDRPFTGAVDDRHPLFWAGWAATGVRSPPET